MRWKPIGPGSPLVRTAVGAGSIPLRHRGPHAAGVPPYPGGGSDCPGVSHLFCGADRIFATNGQPSSGPLGGKNLSGTAFVAGQAPAGGVVSHRRRRRRLGGRPGHGKTPFAPHGRVNGRADILFRHRPAGWSLPDIPGGGAGGGAGPQMVLLPAGERDGKPLDHGKTEREEKENA